MLEFKAVIEKFKMFGPNGEPMEQKIEYRIDPLTGKVCTINMLLGEKAKAFLGEADTELLMKLQRESKTNCPFCHSMEKGTRFFPDFIEDGYVNIGSTLAVPNLFSKAGIDAVVIVNYKQHELFPSNIKLEDFKNAIKVGARLIREGRNYNSSLIHHIMGMNFLHSGGSSVPHPHFQVHLRSVAYSGIADLLNLSERYYKENGRNYWDMLTKKEREINVRYLCDYGDVEWLVPFAPTHQKEVWGLCKKTSSLANITESIALAFAKGIAKVVSFYEQEGHFAFTFTFFSAPKDDAEAFFPLQVRLCARPAFKNLYTSYDTWFSPKFIGDEAHTSSPEEYGARLKKLFVF